MNVLVIHGIGMQLPGFADKFISKLYKKVSEPSKLKIKPVWWQSEVQGRQDSISVDGLFWKKTRKLLINYAGDALAYEPWSADGTYAKVHKILDDQLQDEKPTIIVAHSLGTVLLNNYLWDSQHPDSIGNRLFTASDKAKQTLKNIKAIYTLGSPINIWSLRHIDGGTPFSLPGEAKWYNMYSRTDIIGGPVKKINENYQKDYIKDIPVLVGGIFSFWNPISHVHYFSSNKIINHVARTINDSL